MCRHLQRGGNINDYCQCLDPMPWEDEDQWGSRFWACEECEKEVDMEPDWDATGDAQRERNRD